MERHSLLQSHHEEIMQIQKYWFSIIQQRNSNMYGTGRNCFNLQID